MKHLILILALIAIQVNAQEFSFGENQLLMPAQWDCGTWEKSFMITSDWESIDTIGPFRSSEKRNWIYDSEKSITDSKWVDLLYRPCGQDPSTSWSTDRICSITGIRQRKTRTQTYKYIPRQKSRFELVEDSLNEVEASLRPKDTTQHFYPSSLVIPGDGITLDNKGTIIAVDGSGNLILQPVLQSTPEKKKKKSRKRQ